VGRKQSPFQDLELDEDCNPGTLVVLRTSQRRGLQKLGGTQRIKSSSESRGTWTSKDLVRWGISSKTRMARIEKFFGTRRLTYCAPRSPKAGVPDGHGKKDAGIRFEAKMDSPHYNVEGDARM